MPAVIVAAGASWAGAEIAGIATVEMWDALGFVGAKGVGALVGGIMPSTGFAPVPRRPIDDATSEPRT
jgi:hypothetical protein